MWLDFNKQNTQNFHPSRTGCKRSKEGKIKHMWDIICFFLYKLMYQIIETIGKSWIVESMLVKCKRKDWDLLFVCMPIFFQHSIHICIYIYMNMVQWFAVWEIAVWEKCWRVREITEVFQLNFCESKQTKRIAAEL